MPGTILLSTLKVLESNILFKEQREPQLNFKMSEIPLVIIAQKIHDRHFDCVSKNQRNLIQRSFILRWKEIK